LKILDFRLPIVFCLMALHASGFEATMTVQPPLIQLGETATLSIEVRGSRKVQPPALPNVPGLRFSGASQSQQSSWVNGKSDSFTSFSYQIAPQQTGTFGIGPFNYTIDGESKTLQVELKVVATSGDASQPQSWSEILFARLEPDRTSAYVQEPFGLMLSVYSRQGVQLAGNINMQGMPGTGLSELKWQEIQPSREVVSNAVYDVRRFYSQTRAMSSGVFEFKPSITVQVVIQNKNNRSNDPFFGSMFQRTETRPVDLPVEKVAIAVKPLPDEGRPSGFSGAVGQFAFQVSAQPLDVHPGDPITLAITISGDGNFDRVSMPSLPANGQFRLFGEPVRKQEDKAVRFEQVVSPRTADVTEIPPISFSFFDTQAGRYNTLTNRSIPITVTAASNSAAQVFAAKDSIVLPPPETPFATESDLQRIEGQVKSLWQTVRPWLWTIPSVLLSVPAILFGRKFYRTRQNDTARVRKQKAPRIARKALAAAEHARQKGDPTSFYDALWDALAGYFSHRLNLEPGNVSALTVLSALERTGFDSELINCLRHIFEQVEASRYGLPSREMSPSQLEQLQIDLEKILKTCDREKL
jgi:hypothetical protein